MEYVVLLEKEKGHYRAVVPALPDCVVVVEKEKEHRRPKFFSFAN